MRRLGLAIGAVMALALAVVAIRSLTNAPPAPVVASVPPPFDGPVVQVPSGVEVRYFETISNVPGAEGLTYRFRFVVPAIARQGGTVTADDEQADMQYLCEHFALGRLPATGPRPNQVIISFADRPAAFGEADPAVTQFFSAYSVADGTCTFEVF